MSDSAVDVDVLIIGAGWSGLLCADNCLKQGLSISVLEKREDVGGVYNFSEDPSVPSVSEITELNSSRLVTQISDFPYSESDIEMGDFPSHWDVMKYLKNYAAKKDLLKHIKFNTNVIKCDKSANNIWHTSACAVSDDNNNNNTVIKSKYIACCNGLAGIKKDIPKMLTSCYGGTLINGCNIKKLDKYVNLVRNKNLLIIGGGDTAADFALHFHPFTKNTYWSIRNGQQFFQKRGQFFGNYLGNAIAAYDTVFTPLINKISPMDDEKPGLVFGCKYSTSGDVFAYDNHGICQWKSNKAYMAINLNKSSSVLKYVKMGQIIAKGEIVNINNKDIEFADKSVVKNIDVIIFCTGYKANINFFGAPENKLNDIRNAYEFVFNCYDPSVAYIGYVRPVLYSIIMYSEINSRWASLVWSKKLKLPEQKTMLKIHEENQCEKDTFFGKRFSDNYPTIVHGMHYLKMIKKLNLYQIIASKLNFFQQIYYYCFTTIQTPWLHILDYSSDEIKNHSDLIKKIPSIPENGFEADVFDVCVAILTLLFLRLIQFDTMCYYIQEVRYYLQRKSKLFQAFERNVIIFQQYLVNKKIYPHDSNVYFTYNPSINPKVVEYYNAIILDPNEKKDKNSLERVVVLKYGIQKFAIFYIFCMILLYFFFSK